MTFSINLPTYEKPIFLFEEVEQRISQLSITVNSSLEHSYIKQMQETRLFMITTIDGHVFILRICSEQKYQIIFKIKLEQTCTAIHYWNFENRKSMDSGLVKQKKRLLLGMSTGQILVYNRISTKQLIKFQPKTQHKILSIYSRNKKIYAWNIESEIHILEMNKRQGKYEMCYKNYLKLKYEICAIAAFRNQLTGQYCACAAFNNVGKSKGMPLLFDCEAGVDVIKILQERESGGRAQEENLDIFMGDSEEVQIIAYNRQQNTVIVSSWKQKEGGTNQYYITIYQIILQPYPKLAPMLLFIQKTRPTFLHTYDNYLFTCMEQYAKLYNLQKRKQCFKVKNKYQRWGFILYAYENLEEDGRMKLEFKFMTCKGFNPHLPRESKLTSVELHVNEGVYVSNIQNHDRSQSLSR